MLVIIGLQLLGFPPVSHEPLHPQFRLCITKREIVQRMHYPHASPHCPQLITDTPAPRVQFVTTDRHTPVDGTTPQVSRTPIFSWLERCGTRGSEQPEASCRYVQEPCLAAGDVFQSKFSKHITSSSNVQQSSGWSLKRGRRAIATIFVDRFPDKQTLAVVHTSRRLFQYFIGIGYSNMSFRHMRCTLLGLYC